jgi:anti-sigma B factor antagonist
MRLDVETEQVGPTAFVVALTGELDLYSAPDLKGELVRLTDGGAQEVVVDLTGTTFIDSTALGVLLSAAQQLRAADSGRLSLVVADETIRRIFAMTGLERVFPIYESRGEALAQSAPP